MTTLRDQLDRQLIRGIVGQNITCPRSGELLDYRTCVVLRDDDGDPAAVLSPAGYASATPDEISDWRAHGLYVDQATVPDLFTVVGETTAAACKFCQSGITLSPYDDRCQSCAEFHANQTEEV